MRRHAAQLTLVAFVLSACAAAPEPTVPSQAPTASPTASPTPSPTPVPTPTIEPRSDLVVVDQGFSFYPNPLGLTELARIGRTEYAVVIENPNPDTWAADSTIFTITFYDEAGAVLYVESGPGVDVVFPGRRVAVAGALQLHPTRMEVELDVGEWFELDYDPGGFTVHDVVTAQRSNGLTYTTGIIRSTFALDQRQAVVSVVYRDAAGSILAGSAAFPEMVPAGGEVPFETGPTRPDVVGIASTEVYAAPRLIIQVLAP